MGTSATFSTILNGLESSFTYYGSYSLSFAINEIHTLDRVIDGDSDGIVGLIHINDLLEYSKKENADPRIVQVCEIVKPFIDSLYWYPDTNLFPWASDSQLGVLQVEYGN